MFSLINVGERSGIGLSDVFSTWKEYGYKDPELVESIDPDRVTITLEIEHVIEREEMPQTVSRMAEMMSRITVN